MPRLHTGRCCVRPVHIYLCKIFIPPPQTCATNQPFFASPQRSSLWAMCECRRCDRVQPATQAGPAAQAQARPERPQASDRALYVALPQATAAPELLFLTPPSFALASPCQVSLRPAPFVVASVSAPQPSPSINLGQRPAPHHAAEVFAGHSGMRTAPPHAWAMPKPSPTPSAAAMPHHVCPPSWPREPQSGRDNTPRFKESPPPPRGHGHAHKRKRSSSHGSDADLDQQESTTSSRRCRERRTGRRDNGACEGLTPQPTVVPGVLQLLIDELQDMRRSVKGMKKDVHKLSSKQLCFSDMQHGTHRDRRRLFTSACVAISKVECRASADARFDSPPVRDRR